VRDENGKVIGLLGIFEDITDKKRLEEQLMDVNYSLLEAQQIAQVGSWDWNISKDKVWFQRNSSISTAALSITMRSF
jgi:hypothetical protein